MIGLFRTLLILAAVYFLIRLVSRSLLGIYVNQKVSDSKGSYANPQKKREGEVTINYSSKKDKKYHHNDGEYVDFEEIKE